MSVFKSLCFSLFIGVFLSCNISMAQEDMSADALAKKAYKYHSEKKYNDALESFVKAADRGDVFSMKMIGFYYRIGIGVKPDYQQALQWYLRAADKGDAEAMYRIAGIYTKGGGGINKDKQLASYWTKEADKARRVEILIYPFELLKLENRIK